jgi:hypothetical protein
MANPSAPPDPTPLPGNANLAAQPSGPRSDQPESAVPTKVKIETNTAENRPGHVNASPEDVNITPATLPPQ